MYQRIEDLLHTYIKNDEYSAKLQFLIKWLNRKKYELLKYNLIIICFKKNGINRFASK